ncbi:MAG: hypothetical protein KJ915_09520 [Candidatus Omnitrophica bacterium]|nr:hypothetical protein [Candidatus Omnitrophota bacterium]
MSILQFIFYLGVINIVFNFVWKWIVVLPFSLLFAVLKIKNGIYLFKAIGSYLFVSLVVILTLLITQDANLFLVIVIPLIGAFILYMSSASTSYELRKQAYMHCDIELMRALRYDSLFIIGSLILFFVAIFFPIIIYNPVTVYLFSVVDWVYNFPVIGWIVAIGGVFFLLGIIWQGFIMSAFFIEALTNKLSKEHEKPS